MAGVIFTNGKFQGLDRDGRPAAGGSVEIRDYDTGDYANVYRDSDLSEAQINPVPLDAAGRADIYLESGKAYKVFLRDSIGAIIWSIDKFTPVGGGGDISVVDTIDDLKSLTPSSGMTVFVSDLDRGGEFVWVTPDSTNADDGVVIASNSDTSGRWKRVYQGAVKVDWFGAKGDGNTDDATAINTAIQNHNVVEFSNKTYLVNSGISRDGDVEIISHNATLKISSNVGTGNFTDGAILKLGNSNWHETVTSTLNADVTAGDTSITVSDATPFSVGDWIGIIGADGSYDASNAQFRNADIKKIIAISGTTLILNEPVTFGYPTGAALFKFHGASVAIRGILNFKLENTSDNFTALEIVGGLGVYIQGITVSGGGYRGITIKYSKYGLVDNILTIMPDDNSSTDDKASVIVYSSRDVRVAGDGYHKTAFAKITAEPVDSYAFVSDNITAIEGNSNDVIIDKGCHRSIVSLLKAGIIQVRKGESVTVGNSSGINIEKSLTVGGNVTISSDLSVDGALSVPNGNISAGGNLSISGDIHADGKMSFLYYDGQLKARNGDPTAIIPVEVFVAQGTDQKVYGAVGMVDDSGGYEAGAYLMQNAGYKDTDGNMILTYIYVANDGTLHYYDGSTDHSVNVS